MLTFWKDNDQLILSYAPEFGGNKDWVMDELDREGEVLVRKTFFFLKVQLYSVKKADIDTEVEDPFYEDQPEPVHFVLGSLSGDYYKIGRGILVDNFDIYIHQDVEITSKLFIADSKISIFRIISELINEDLYLGGEHPGAIPEEGYKQMLTRFPTTYEQKRYVQARVSSVLKEYLENLTDAETKYRKYMNKRTTYKGNDLQKIFRDSELEKYQALLDKLRSMLKSEETYSEKQWQEEILQILLLIYPKYIAVFREVPFKSDNLNEKFLDYMLVDSNGHVDIIEIKQPFEKSIVTQGKYRNNFIPLRELSGTIMQLEKYIYLLNRLGAEGERKLTERYKEQLPEGLTIKITNPGGIIIMGRDNNLTEDQKLDFEVVKRKYKNVADIITYENLLLRLSYTIEQIKKS